ANKTSLPPKEKKVQPKKPTPTPKVKRLTDEKSASKRPRLVEDQSAPKRSRGRPSNSTKFPGSYKLRPRIQPSEDEITSSTRTIEESPESFSDSSVTVENQVELIVKWLCKQERSTVKESSLNLDSPPRLMNEIGTTVMLTQKTNVVCLPLIHNKN
ncbi:unnamed protein product, partial [Allacma fusca]